MYTLYEYPKCSTCKKAKAWLDQQGVKYQAIDIKATPPSSKMDERDRLACSSFF